MTFGLVPILLLGLTLEGNPLYFRWTTSAIVSLLYLALVGTVIAFILYYWLVQHMAVTKSMLIALVTPVTAVILGMIVLGEQLDWRTIAGGILILSGIAFVVIRAAKEGRGGIGFDWLMCLEPATEGHSARNGRGFDVCQPGYPYGPLRCAWG